MDDKIASIRQEYSHKSLLEQDIEKDPVVQFGKWWKEVLEARVVEPNAMFLATASSDGMPSGRVVLLKEFSPAGFIFFTNYNSFKGQQLAENPKASLVFFWKELERQVRITGLVEKISVEASDNYFHSRPPSSQIGAMVSPQSSVIENRNWLDKHFETLSKKFEGAVIPRPSHWGGYIIKPVIIEFWQGRPSRLHDRIQFTLNEEGSWKMERLAP